MKPAAVAWALAALILPCVASKLAQPEPPGFLEIRRQGTNVVISWNFGELENAAKITGPWTPLPSAASPIVLSPDSSAAFFRIR